MLVMSVTFVQVDSLIVSNAFPSVCSDCSTPVIVSGNAIFWSFHNSLCIARSLAVTGGGQKSGGGGEPFQSCQAIRHHHHCYFKWEPLCNVPQAHPNTHSNSPTSTRQLNLDANKLQPPPTPFSPLPFFHHSLSLSPSLYVATLVSMGTALGLGVVPVTSLAPGVGPTFFLFFSLKPLYHHHHNHHCPNRTAPPSSIWSHACWGCARRRKPKLEIKLSRLEETKAKGGTFCVRDKTCPLEKTIMCVCVFQPPCRHMCAGIVLRLQPVTSSVF